MLLMCLRCAHPESYYITSAVKLASFLKDRQEAVHVLIYLPMRKTVRNMPNLEVSKINIRATVGNAVVIPELCKRSHNISLHCDCSVSKRVLNRFNMRYESIFKLCGEFGSVVEEPYLVPASPGMMMVERADFCCIDSKLPGVRPRDPTLHRYYLSHPSPHCAFKVTSRFAPAREYMP